MENVRFIDGVQLEAWLAQCPAVAAWHARNTFRIAPQHGARSTDDFWDEFSNRFSPRITEQVLLCDRDKATEQLLSALMGAPQQFSMIADSPDEVLAFAVAAIRAAKPEIRLFLEARTLVIDTVAAGRALLGGDGSVFLVRGEAARSPGQFASSIPTLVPLGRQQRISKGIQLERPSGFAMGRAMMSMGYSQAQAENLARDAGRSLAALARQIPGGASDEPPWIGDAHLVLPAVLAGAWDAANPMDAEVVRLLSAAPQYAAYEKQLRKFSNDPDPPLDREGTAWKVRAPMDAFIHIGHLIGPESLEALRPVLTSVFGRLDPEHDPDEELVFPPKRPEEYSDWLRDGLATTLLLIAVWSKQARLDLPPGAGQTFANEVMAALPGLGSDPRLLTSLRNELPLLAEAAPDPLLAALERMLEGDGATIRPIFDEIDGLLSPTSHHTGVLWALETLAWDPAYFRRSCLILAGLAAIDPGGKLANRPLASLAEIFLLWKPGTNASAESRLAALDTIIASYPSVAWKLVKHLLPDGRGFSSGTARPKLREEATAPFPTMTYADLWQAQAAVASRVLELTRGHPERVAELVDLLTRLPTDLRIQAMQLIDDTMASANTDHRSAIWTSLRELVRKHQRFASAKWALPEAELMPLRVLVDKYAPADPTIELADLFDHWSLGTGVGDEVSNETRSEAVRSLFDEHGVHAVFTLLEAARMYHLVVGAIEQAELPSDDVRKLAEEALARDPAGNLAIVLAALYRRVAGSRTAETWLTSKRSLLDADRIAALLFAWPMAPATWSAARRLGVDILDAYWRTVHPHWIDGSRRLLLVTMWNLQKRGRARAALQTVHNRLAEIPSDRLLAILAGIVPELNSGAATPDNMIGYELEKAFGALDSRDDVTVNQIASLEYGLLPLLEHQERSLRIYDLMASDPEMFHQILRDVYRADDEEPGDSNDQDRARWRQAYALLTGFSTIPGRSGETLDAASLRAWVNRVRELGVETRRVEITESAIGNVLARAPTDDVDGGWPHRLVRDEIERANSEVLERGLAIERFNMRGVTTRGITDGGALERVESATYRGHATKAAAWPRTAAMLRGMADNYERDAEREDSEARKRLLRS